MNFEVLLAPVAIMVSALGAWYFAHKAIQNAQDISRKKNTFDYMSKLSWDRDYIQAKNTFLEIKIGPKKLRAVSEEYERLKSNGHGHNAPEGDETARKTIEEHAAIKSFTLDEQIVRENIQQQFVDHVDACKDFIEHTRRNSGFRRPERIWCEVQLLAEKWRI
ncbi:DUF4760 domain-containing protein [Roseinatronobacter monicus]|uniref:Uncharacterized protein DUF4760 n=1 Tax=Roseinatronobacter monicus TaxID=393481 RepID=A0A543KH90_9RHOB|nr:DUF4760 domain-containing protein [Roseinatronobacter monicus]TQM94453.1 uncharacterized protein DUF4760 [Roseinatronobacter monicus]